MSADSIVIVAARRTPIGAFQGALSAATAPSLGATVARQLLTDSGVQGAELSQVVFGCVLPAGVGQAPARQASLAADIPISVPTYTVNKVCGSGMQTIIGAHDAIVAGSADIVLAGGMESMSNAPYIIPKARAGLRMGHQELLDHMFYDGLQNPYDGNMMGQFGDSTASHFGFTREDQDAFSIASVERAQASIRDGLFDAEVVPVTVNTRKGEVVVNEDEEPGRLDVEKIPGLRAAFSKDGTVTAASSSSISDGAAGVVVMRESEADKRGLKPLARILGSAAAAKEPEWFTTAPVDAINRLQQKLDIGPAHIDLYEINEAFACVTMAAMHECEIPHDKVNVRGGACALGHPIGATGARIVVTLIHALRARGEKTGIASLCIGGGEALAIALETL